MSSDVHAKWMNSATRATSGTAAKRSFSQYSTALTSWLVCRSISLTRAASAGAERLHGLVERRARGGGKRRHFGNGGLVGKRDEPGELDAHAMADEAELAEVFAQGCDLAGVAAVERRQRGQRGNCGGRHDAAVGCGSSLGSSSWASAVGYFSSCKACEV